MSEQNDTNVNPASDRGCYVIMELMQAYERRVRSDCTTQEQIDKRPWECAEYIKAADYLRAVWHPHEPLRPAAGPTTGTATGRRTAGRRSC